MAAAKRVAAVAHHEAGHAVAAIKYRIAFREVTIMPTDHWEGRVHTPLAQGFCEKLEYGSLPDRLVERHVLLFLAGAEAEKRFRGRYDHAGASHDRRMAVDLLSSHSGSMEEVNAWLRLIDVRTRAFVRQAWKDIEILAGALLERPTLSGRQVRALLGQRFKTRKEAL